MKEKLIYISPVGNIQITEEQGKLLEVKFTEENPLKSENPLLNAAKDQLDEYFLGKRKDFKLPIDMNSLNGTPFQKSVWKALMTIPYGKTISYKELATMIGNPKACRAVGNANGKNPISIIIPCHRVIASDMSLGGYDGGLKIKAQLLDIEKG